MPPEQGAKRPSESPGSTGTVSYATLRSGQSTVLWEALPPSCVEMRGHRVGPPLSAGMWVLSFQAQQISVKTLQCFCLFEFLSPFGRQALHAYHVPGTEGRTGGTRSQEVGVSFFHLTVPTEETSTVCV